MKKTFDWFNEQDEDYEFHDYKKLGIDEKTLKSWCKTIGWELLVNRRGTTWRKLPDEIKENIDEPSAIKAMQDNPSLIKRPVVERNGRYAIGFDIDAFEGLKP